MISKFPVLFSVLLGLLALSGAAVAQGPNPPVKLSLVSDLSEVAPGETFKAGVKAEIGEGWHLYWKNAGDSGLPTEVTWVLPDGFKAGPLRYPIPHRYVQRYTEDFTSVTHTFEGTAFLISEITAPANLAAGERFEIGSKVEWQACNEMGCVSGEAAPSVSLSIGEASAQSPDAGLLETAWANGEGSVVHANATVSVDDGSIELKVALPDGYEFDGELYFLPESPGVVDPVQDQISAIEDNLLSIFAPLSSDGEQVAEVPAALAGLVVGEGAQSLWVNATPVGAASTPTDGGAVAAPSGASTGGGTAYPPTDSPEAEEIRAAIAQIAKGVQPKSTPFLLMIAAAFIGGIILNLMPCVFPVLGIKILGFVQQAGSDRGKIRRHGLVFGLGVLLSLWALVGVLFIIRAAGSSAGWGFQLQEPWFLVFMIVVMFAFGLNLCGVFEIGTSLIGAGGGLQSKHGYSGSFFSGVLAVLVATPCTGPFMGPALGFALSGPPLIGFAVFTSLAIGLALPYVILSFFPALIEKLPRPGAWMETFKQLMAFPLFATVVWLVGVLGKAQGLGAVMWTLIGLVVISMGFWIYGKYGTPVRKAPTRWMARFATVGAIAVFVWFGANAVNSVNPAGAVASGKAVHGLEYESFDPRKIVEHQRAGRNVFIDFTAGW